MDVFLASGTLIANCLYPESSFHATSITQPASYLIIRLHVVSLSV